MSEQHRLLFICPKDSPLESVFSALQSKGCDVRLAHSPYRALLTHRSRPVEVIVIDGRFLAVDDDFLSVVREIRSDVFVLGCFSGEHRVRVAGALATGLDAFVTEPFYPAELLALIDNALRRHNDYIRRDQQLADKLDALGEFAKGVAHEVNNPLTTISGWLQIFLSDTDRADPRYGNFSMLLKECERIQQVVRDLLDFAGQTSSNRAPVDVNRLLEDLLAGVGRTADSGVHVIKSLADRLPAVMADERLLREACRLLITNATEVTNGSGRIEVTTRPADDGCVEIVIADNGAGISEETLPHVFDPFYALNHDDVSGLGLSVCYGIVRGLGGRISVHSQAGKGSTFNVILPVLGNAPNATRKGNGNGNGNGNRH